MFWQSLWHGIRLFGNVEVSLAVLAFLGAQLLLHGLLRWATSLKGNEEAASAGCLTQIVGLLFQALVLSCLLLWLLPILLGFEPRGSWAAIEPFVLVAGRAGVLAVAAMSLLAFFPVVGRFLAGSPGLEILLGGGLLFRILAHPYLEGRLGREVPAASVFPGFWECLGYVAIAFVAGRLLMLATLPLRPAPGQAANRFVQAWGPALDALVGLVVLFMYAQYVALARQL